MEPGQVKGVFFRGVSRSGDRGTPSAYGVSGGRNSQFYGAYSPAAAAPLRCEGRRSAVRLDGFPDHLSHINQGSQTRKTPTPTTPHEIGSSMLRSAYPPGGGIPSIP